MEDAYKEMFMELYKNMAFMQRVLKRLDSTIDDILLDTTGMHVANLKEQMAGETEVERRLKRLLKAD